MMLAADPYQAKQLRPARQSDGRTTPRATQLGSRCEPLKSMPHPWLDGQRMYREAEMRAAADDSTRHQLSCPDPGAVARAPPATVASNVRQDQPRRTRAARCNCVTWLCSWAYCCWSCLFASVGFVALLCFLILIAARASPNRPTLQVLQSTEIHGDIHNATNLPQCDDWAVNVTTSCSPLHLSRFIARHVDQDFNKQARRTLEACGSRVENATRCKEQMPLLVAASEQHIANIDAFLTCAQYHSTCGAVGKVSKPRGTLGEQAIAGFSKKVVHPVQEIFNPGMKQHEMSTDRSPDVASALSLARGRSVDFCDRLRAMSYEDREHERGDQLCKAYQLLGQRDDAWIIRCKKYIADYESWVDTQRWWGDVPEI